VWRLATALAPAQRATASACLQINAHEIGFNVGTDVWLDVAEFERCCDAAERATTGEDAAMFYRQAVDVYTADLLADCYEDWCILERERLQHRYLRALTRLLAWHVQAGQHELGMDYAHQILALDPLREEIHRDLIQMQLGLGQYGAALRQYRACEGLLREELGIEPLPETRALLPRILQLAQATAAAAAERDCQRIAHIDEQLNARPELRPILSSLRDAFQACEEVRGRLVDTVRLVERLTRPA
jgi:DNA-binding SARP family transcriptional activator